MNSHFIQTKKILYYSTVAIILVATVFVSGILTTASAQAGTSNGQYLLAQTSAVDSLDTAADVAKLKRSETLGTQIGGIIKGVLGLVGVLLLLMLIYGGFVWMTAGGNSEKVQQANKIINNAIIGLIIIFLSYAMTNFWIDKVKNATSNTTGNTTTGACVIFAACAENQTLQQCQALGGSLTLGTSCSVACPSCVPYQQ